MYFELVQKNMDLFSADFEIIRDDSCVGTMHLQGSLGQKEATWTGSFGEDKVQLSPGMVSPKLNAGNPFRPYTIALNGTEKGGICQADVKAGLFSTIDYHHMEFDGVEYKMYPIGFGQEGGKNPIYCNDEQIALIETDCVIVDGLHVYKIFCVDGKASVIALLFAMYMYSMAGYKAGEKVIKSVEKIVSITTSKHLKAKYDPSFKERV